MPRNSDAWGEAYENGFEAGLHAERAAIVAWLLSQRDLLAARVKDDPDCGLFVTMLAAVEARCAAFYAEAIAAQKHDAAVKQKRADCT